MTRYAIRQLQGKLRFLGALALLTMVGCQGAEVSFSKWPSSIPIDLLADYERQTPFATGPQGESLISGLYTDYRPNLIMGCSASPLEPSISYDWSGVELSLAGYCSASYRRPNPRWYTAVDGFFRVGAMLTNPPPTADASIEFGVLPQGRATVDIRRIYSDGSTSQVCEVSLDSKSFAEKEAICDVTFEIGGWYTISIRHTERLPDLYIGGNIAGGLKMQFMLPLGFDIEYFTDFYVGGFPTEKILTERECPTLPSSEIPPTVRNNAVLEPGPAAKYYFYDPYDCAALADSVTPICENDEPDFSILYGANGAWGSGDLMVTKYPSSSATPQPFTCSAFTNYTENWAAQFTGYMRFEAIGPQAPTEFYTRLDGDINDGLRLVVYDGESTMDPPPVLCTVSSMWREVISYYRYQSVTGRPWSLVGPDDCERGVTLRTGVYYPIQLDFYHHQTGSDYMDKAKIELWWRNVGGRGLVLALYH